MLKMGTMCGRVTRRVCSGRWLSGQLTCEASSSSWQLLSRCAGPSTSFPRSLFALWLHLATAQALIYLDFSLPLQENAEMRAKIAAQTVSRDDVIRMNAER